jgi:hypothetical protein
LLQCHVCAFLYILEYISNRSYIEIRVEYTRAHARTHARTHAHTHKHAHTHTHAHTLTHRHTDTHTRRARTHRQGGGHELPDALVLLHEVLVHVIFFVTNNDASVRVVCVEWTHRPSVFVVPVCACACMMCVCVFVFVCLCVCVRARERVCV